MKKKIKFIANEVIDLEINALKKLKSSLSSSLETAVDLITNCQSKVIVCGVGKSGIIASKIAATLSSVGTPAFNISANDCSHGDLGSIAKKDIVILISNSGNSSELKNIIQFVNRYKIKLIGISSKKNSLLNKNSDVKLLIPEVKEAGYGIVPTSSTTAQLALGDVIAIATMQKKKFGKLDFKRFHPAGSLGNKLKTVEDLMITKTKMPFINENLNVKKALKIISLKKLGTVITRDKKNNTTGILTDGDIKRLLNKFDDIKKLQLKKIIKKGPISVNKDLLAVKALKIMNDKKITSLCVHSKSKKNKTIGLIHIHNILDANIQ
ncbi:KpsF/GutQ family sugar-phosphate isomerase [Candidatus Pelagibacter communis]|uniref:KpsF/GutQ family sugar-phosphate isomerase n=1 Tax=Pelagibacter ubique TaxID=198252 RepID=UPI00092CEF2C|nr:KpsF/GutQ family sugar-phosphate isomerase [Candidatus Pelagibacter ubique]